MSKKDKSGSAAVQSSAENVVPVNPVEVEKTVDPSRHSCQCAMSRDRMLWELYLAKISSVNCGEDRALRKVKTISETLLSEAKIALDVYLNQTKQEK